MGDESIGDIKMQLGRIEATIEAVKEDVAELKLRAGAQSEDLESAYAKAKARQDSIRDDLQHQIQANSSAITSLDSRIAALETTKERTLVKWWDKLIDKVAWIVLIALIAVIFRWLNAPSEILEQLPK